jgi:hypothetical protein
MTVKRQKAAAQSLGTCMRVQLLLLLYPVQVSAVPVRQHACQLL